MLKYLKMFNQKKIPCIPPVNNDNKFVTDFPGKPAFLTLCWKTALNLEAVVRRCSMKKGVLRNFTKFKKTCARISFLIKLQA